MSRDGEHVDGRTAGALMSNLPTRIFSWKDDRGNERPLPLNQYLQFSRDPAEITTCQFGADGMEKSNIRVHA